MHCIFRHVTSPSTSRLFPRIFLRTEILNRGISTTKIDLGGKRKTRKKVREEVAIKKTKTHRPMVNVWSGISIRDLSRQMGKSIDDIFECIMESEYADIYDKSSQVLIDPVLINSIARTFGLKACFMTAPSENVGELLKQELKKDLDVYARPAAKDIDCMRRPPVVTIMGHVDHGKTTLLDSLRMSRIVDTEFGGITQHIGAFSVTLPETGNQITFLDTPGHAAFHEIRRRGANATDMVVLVVAADDGVMDQTRESIEFARSAGVPLIVAINKCDKFNADVRGTKETLLAEGIHLEEFHGEIPSVCISALEGTNLNVLQETIVAQAEMLDIKADYSGMIEGVVIEATQEHGKGKVSTILVQRGTLNRGDYLVAGKAWAKVRTMQDENANTFTQAKPGSAVQITGWRDELPTAGDLVLQVQNETQAVQVNRYRLQKLMQQKAENDSVIIDEKRDEERRIYEENRSQKLKTGFKFGRIRDPNYMIKKSDRDIEIASPNLAFVLKCDVTSSLEAILQVLSTYHSHIVSLDIIDQGIGPPSINDLKIAKEFGGSIITFNVGESRDIRMAAENEGVAIHKFNVIYKLVDVLKEKLSLLMPLKEQQIILGEVDVVRVFQIKDKNKKVSVGGSICKKGYFDKKELCRIERNNSILHEGRLGI